MCRFYLGERERKGQLPRSRVLDRNGPYFFEISAPGNELYSQGVGCSTPKKSRTLITDRKSSCLALSNTYAQTSYVHNFSAVPSSFFNECVTTTAAEEDITVDPLDGWASLNFIGSASVSAPMGWFIILLVTSTWAYWTSHQATIRLPWPPQGSTKRLQASLAFLI